MEGVNRPDQFMTVVLHHVHSEAVEGQLRQTNLSSMLFATVLAPVVSRSVKS
jgi:hypothetical protein